MISNVFKQKNIEYEWAQFQLLRMWTVLYNCTLSDDGPVRTEKCRSVGILKHYCNFKVCKSVYHRTIQINHELYATIFQFIILTFIYSSTCFGRFPAQHQELNDCSASLWFYLFKTGKTRGCHCSHRAPDDGREKARNMLSCK